MRPLKPTKALEQKKNFLKIGSTTLTTPKANGDDGLLSAGLPSSRRGPRHVPRGLTDTIAPRILGELIAIRVLELICQRRVARSVDIAAHCFPERTYSASQQATRRCLSRLVGKGYIQKYVTEKKHTVYAVTVAGAKFLEEHAIGPAGAEPPRASTQRVSSMTNPEHLNWMNFITVACPHRGLVAFTEFELMRLLDIGTKKKPGLASYKKKWFRPDALALEEQSLIWFEIDASKKGNERAKKFVELTHLLGTQISGIGKLPGVSSDKARLEVIVTHTTKRAYFNRIRNQLDKLVADTRRVILTEDSGNRRYVDAGAGIYEVWKARYLEDTSHQSEICVGYVILQMLPTKLPNYKHVAADDSYKHWFDTFNLPYRRPSRLGPWPTSTTETPFLSMRMDQLLYN